MIDCTYLRRTGDARICRIGASACLEWIADENGASSGTVGTRVVVADRERLPCLGPEDQRVGPTSYQIVHEGRLTEEFASASKGKFVGRVEGETMSHIPGRVAVIAGETD